MKYQSLEKELVELILSGQWTSPDGRFISERRISEMFGVSRTAVHRAISGLCKQGYLVQIHGKGTFIKRANQSQELDSVTRCMQHYTEMGMHPSITVLCKEVTSASTSIASNLRIAVDEPVLKIVKVFKADRILFNETFSYLPMSRFPELEHADFSTYSIMEILRMKYGVQPKRTENSIEAILPPLEVAQNLKITAHTPIIFFESVTSGIINGRFLPLEYFKCYYKTDRFRFNFIQEHD